MKENLELEYNSSFEMHLESTIRYAGLIGADSHFPFLKKVGYAGIGINLFMLLLDLFSKGKTSLIGLLLSAAGFLFSLFLIFYRRLWIRGMESVMKKSGWEPELGKLSVNADGMIPDRILPSVNKK